MLTNDLEQFVISDSATIRDAMAAIERNSREVVFVKNNNEAIVGVITDGDIRRALLNGLTMEHPALTARSSFPAFKIVTAHLPAMSASVRRGVEPSASMV